MRNFFLRILVVVFVLLLVLAVVAMVFPQKFLCVDSGPAQADVMVVLGGGSAERPERAAELFKEHAAPRIIVSGRGDCEINRQLLIEDGVPAKVIEMETQSRTTRENAQFTVKLLREQKLAPRHPGHFVVSFAAGAGVFPALCAGDKILFAPVVCGLRAGRLAGPALRAARLFGILETFRLLDWVWGLPVRLRLAKMSNKARAVHHAQPRSWRSSDYRWKRLEDFFARALGGAK